MVTKPVLFTNCLKFDKAGDAEAHFRRILNSGELQTYLVGGEREDVDILFRNYCAATEWQMPAEPEHYFRAWNRSEGRSTRGFFVEYDNGTVDDFSYIKAVRAVANWMR